MSSRRKVPGGPGTELHKRFKSMGAVFCDKCSNLRNRMDSWGVSGCRDPGRHRYIVDKVFRSARLHWKCNSSWVLTRDWWFGNESVADCLAVAAEYTFGSLDDALRKQAEIHVNAAIDAAEALGFE